MPVRTFSLALALATALASPVAGAQPDLAARAYRTVDVAAAMGAPSRLRAIHFDLFAPRAPSRFRPVDRHPAPRRFGGAVFRVTHENHAWLPFKARCEIRADGRIVRARYASPPDRILGYDVIGRVSVAEVQRMRRLLREAARYELTEPRQVMADFGSITLAGVVRGREVKLKIWGDFISLNPSRAARRVVAWTERVFRDDCPS